MPWNCVGLIRDVAPRVLSNQLLQNPVRIIVDQKAARLDFVNENSELVEIIFKGWKNINMIPGNSGDDGYMREEKMKFWSLFNCARRIFISFAYYHRRICYFYRLF